jgi:hypothetical protein
MASIKWGIDPSSGNKWANIISTNSNKKSDYEQFTVQHNSNNSKLEFVVRTNRGRAYMQSNTKLQKGKWYHVVCIYDGSKMKIYINGTLDSSKSKNGDIIANNSQFELTIGARAYRQ